MTFTSRYGNGREAHRSPSHFPVTVPYFAPRAKLAKFQCRSCTGSVGTVPRCPSTQTAAGVKSACGRLLASERMPDGRVAAPGRGAGRAGFVAHMLRRRCEKMGRASRFVLSSGFFKKKGSTHFADPSPSAATVFRHLAAKALIAAARPGGPLAGTSNVRCQ